MQTLQALFAMSRPLQLVAVTMVYLIGTAIAVSMDSPFDVEAAIVGYLALIPVSASIHYANEYADYETDALTTPTPFSGGSGALSATGLPRSLALQGAQATLVIGYIIAIIGVAGGLLSVAAVMVLTLGGFFGWMYSMPPLQLAWRGWGELDNAALGGVVLPVYGYAVQTGRVTLDVIAICIPFGALVFINLLATTWPDRAADAEVGKFTLATQWTVSRLRLLYSVGATFAFMWMLGIAGWLLPPIVLAGALLSVPIVIWGWVVYTRWESPFPTVFAMIVMMSAYLLSWGVLAIQN